MRLALVADGIVFGGVLNIGVGRATPNPFPAVTFSWGIGNSVGCGKACGAARMNFREGVIVLFYLSIHLSTNQIHEA